MADSPKVFYKLQDASGNPVDSSGNGFNMNSITGTPDYHQTGPTDAFSIRLQAGEVIERSTGPVSTVTDNFTVEIVMKLSTIGGDGRNCFANGDTNGWGIMIDGDTKFRSYINGGGGSGVKSANAVPTGSFAHLVVHRDAGQWRYYFNGNLDTDGAAGGTPGAPTGPMRVGAGSLLDGWFAYCAVYESALSATRIGVHYNQLASVGTGSGSAGRMLILGVG